MKTAPLDFNNQLFSFRDSLQGFAFSFTRNEEDATDLVQDTLLKAMRYAQSFQEGTNLKSWLFIILKNTFINNYRRKGKFNSYMDEASSIAMNESYFNLTYNTGESNCSVEDIHKALKKLSQGYYLPFIKYFEGYKYHEIAEELNIPIGTVKTRIHMARMMLKKNLRMYSER
ncbi:RNA polymerase sigma-70 factor (ECF subfamily) [Pedobacter sp. AK017]|uniref:RNA polymerase sigma factor n=1 Tax=Pedobacter sp. AK017 TaxID=2723073 RepID=UPI00162294C5|nr:RNA polymerase sigma factor [Pedobacter sp. AK017]MBB5437849.1 RNA polymerase sigma-70 factor (ECF subfamily) [Pedobacter sp. AK017]